MTKKKMTKKEEEAICIGGIIAVIIAVIDAFNGFLLRSKIIGDRIVSHAEFD